MFVTAVMDNLEKFGRFWKMNSDFYSMFRGDKQISFVFHFRTHVNGLVRFFVGVSAKFVTII